MESSSILAKYFVLAFSALLPVVNPVGSALILLGLVGDAPTPVYHDLAKKIAVRTVLVFVVIEFAGAVLLTFFGISLPVVQLAGGLVLATIGWNLLDQQYSETNQAQASVTATSLDSLQQQAFYPLTFPITVGPGCIVVMLTLSARATEQSTAEDVIAHLGILAAVIALSLLVFFCYANAPRITSRVSPQTAHGILRVIAFVLLCIGVQIASTGVQTLLRAALKQ
jgi:multiple antibiotic resistance protein